MQPAVEGYRLSPQQKRLWLLQSRTRITPFLVQCAIVIEGRLHRPSLTAALQDLIRRHEILRTSLKRLIDSNRPLQVITLDAPLLINEIDLNFISAAERKVAADSIMARVRGLCFNTEESPLQHTLLLALSPARHVLLLTLPAFFADAVTADNIAYELGHVYESLSAGRHIDAEPLQYADLSEWQNEMLEAEETKAGREYWTRLDIGALPQLQLPGFVRSPADAEFEPRVVKLSVEGGLLSQIESTPSTLSALPVFLLACWTTLLSRLSGETECLIGVAFDGRRSPELEKALGLFVRYLPISVSVSPESLLADVAGQIRHLMDEAHKRQEYFTWAQQTALGDLSTAAPYFDSCFEYTRPAARHYAGDTAFSVADQYICTDRFKVRLCCVHRESGGLDLDFYYDSSAIDASAVGRMAGYFQNLLASAVCQSDIPVCRLKLIGDQELYLQSAEWNKTAKEYPAESHIHNLFERQADAIPDAIALTFENQSVSYGELNRRADLLASHLLQLGVRPEATVGICMDRSAELVAGLLGILKTGGAFLPLDPTYPISRLSYMLEDAQASVALTESDKKDLFPSPAALLCVDEALMESTCGRVTADVSAQSLAYVIYTSGSTGLPKGAMNTHGGLLNRLLWMQDAYGLTGHDRVLQKTPYSFDVSVWEFFWPLIVGANLVVARPGGHLDVSYLVNLISEEQITVLHFVPSMLRMFLEHGNGNCESLRCVICSGESLTLPLQERFHDSFDAELHNLYGPTEASIDVTYWACERSGALDMVPIGRPIANTQIYVLDPYLQPAPVGTIGELYIGGAGLGRGYNGRPELTAERFLPSPYGDEPGARFYSTGDLARRMADGVIDYVGRLDHQVKLRGYRIELAEIESALEQQPGVSKAVVTVREDSLGNKSLAAYLVFERGSRLRSRELRDRLREKLPAYMIPTTFTVLDSIPTTPNGKIDRKALPVPRVDRAELETDFAPARVPIEKQLVEICAALLGIEELGIDDDFFDLGGHSLLATQFVSRVRETFRVEFPLAWFFTGKATVARMAVTIEELQISQADPGEVAAALDEISSLSDSQVEAMLANRGIFYER